MDNKFDSRRTYVLMLLYLTTSLANLVNQANTAVTNGTLGYLVYFFFASVFMGIPLSYMELSVGQFTKRNCVDVWKIRPCLSHIGYVVLLWQMVILFYNHTDVTYLFHYLLISFQKPIPYFSCGKWSYRNCNMAEKNYTVFSICVRGKRKWMDFCNNILTTYPQYQYYRSTAISNTQSTVSTNWRIYMSSALVLIIVYVHNFKRLKSAKWFLIPFALYPYVGYFTMLIGSMRQKGLEQKYEQALDTGMVKYNAKGRLSQVIHQVMYGLGLGNGIMMTIASKGSFRTPCYINAVLAVLMSLFFTIVVVFTTAMMSCPFAFENIINVLDQPLSFTFEKVPMMLFEYDSNQMYILINYSVQATLGITTDVVITFSLMEILMNKVPKLAKYPAATYAIAMLIIFLVTIPFLGPFARHVVASGYYRVMNVISTFMVITESLVFILWYGFDRFSEDVHFMQGIKPNNFLKIGWMVSFLILGYVMCNELYYVMLNPRGMGDIIGFFTLISVMSLVIVLTLVRLLWAAFKSKQAFFDAVRLDPHWGPKNSLLRRSRALFTAEAMTKEYIYRQYQLQAGIQERQRRANIRTTQEHTLASTRRATPPVLDFNF